MASKYRISKERDGFAVSRAKTGEILFTFDRDDQAADYIVEQVRADEQSRVMAKFNDEQELRCLAAELRAELFS